MAFKVAIIGCGGIAGGYDRNVPTEWSISHAGAYHLHSDTKLVAAADPNPKALQAFCKKWNVKCGYSDYHELLRKEPIDMVSLCLPTARHAEALAAAVTYGIRAVFCEKPLSNDLGEAKRMVDLSRGRITAVNYFRRWNSTLHKLAGDLRNGRFGNLISITMRYTKGLLVNGSHLVDLLIWFFGKPQRLRYIRTALDDPEDPGVDFLMIFDSGLTAYCIQVPQAPYVFIDVDILAEKGRIVIGQRGQEITTYEIADDSHYRFPITTRPHRLETRWRNCTTRAVEEIINCLTNGGTTACTMKDALCTLEVCHQVLDLKKQSTGHTALTCETGNDT